MYRDDREALRHRIAMLEGQLAEVDALRHRVATLEAENQKLTADLAMLRPAVVAKPIDTPTGTVLRLRIQGPGLDQSVAFDKDIVKVGRLKSLDLFIDHAPLNRMHAVIERVEGEFTIIDLGSTEGTSVNGKRTNKHKLSRGDVIMMCGITLTVL